MAVAAWLCIHMAALRHVGLPANRFAVPSIHHARPAARAEVVMAGMRLPAGSLVALATPMTEDGAVDIPKLREVLRWHRSEGTDGIVILGTTGEASVLSSMVQAVLSAQA